MDLSELRDRLTAIQKGLKAELAKGGNPETRFAKIIAHLNYCVRTVKEIEGEKR